HLTVSTSTHTTYSLFSFTAHSLTMIYTLSLHDALPIFLNIIIVDVINTLFPFITFTETLLYVAVSFIGRRFFSNKGIVIGLCLLDFSDIRMALSRLSG